MGQRNIAQFCPGKTCHLLHLRSQVKHPYQGRWVQQQSKARRGSLSSIEDRFDRRAVT